MPEDFRDEIARRAEAGNVQVARSKAMSDAIRGGFAAKAEQRRERQEARGIPATAPAPNSAEEAQMDAARRKIAKGLAAEEQ
jgi:hypothetical protein